MSGWIHYLAQRIGELKGYDECGREEHSIALELAAREALESRLPAAVEDRLLEALDAVAEAYVADQRRHEDNRRHWQRILAETKSAPTEAPVEAR